MDSAGFGPSFVLHQAWMTSVLPDMLSKKSPSQRQSTMHMMTVEPTLGGRVCLRMDLRSKPRCFKVSNAWAEVLYLESLTSGSGVIASIGV